MILNEEWMSIWVGLSYKHDLSTDVDLSCSILYGARTGVRITGEWKDLEDWGSVTLQICWKSENK